MVERTLQLDSVFSSLSDSTRRDMLAKLAYGEQSVGELAKNYGISFAATSKHLKVMERAKLIVKRKEGKKRMVSMAPTALKAADEYLEQYRKVWQGRYNKLDTIINKED